MDFKTTLDQQRAVRKFTDKKISDADIRDIIEDAQRAPSLLNSQPWRAYVVQGNIVKKIRSDFKKLIENGQLPREDFSKVMAVQWDTFPSKNMSTMSDDLNYFLRGELDQFDKAQLNLFNAPTLVFMTIPKKTSAWSIFDLGAFSQTLMLSAQSRGISTMPAHAIVKFPDIIRKYVDIPDDESIGMGIGLGYRDKKAMINNYRAKRLPVDKILKIVE
ncbi:nitroreductase [Lactobacillus colini]|uniref:Nitroreductase n=1 Tax=Lactobacillus colini TaxID=1819254 RepID=A0ABS4MDW7_9LACO|nr:nitroreductase [Lactobacillus colini]MBP2057572.1 nitroreductase [Lactobacillus colini]